MRGARSLIKVVLSFTRIIPADAGSTSFHIFSLVLAEDHPRGCGEHMSLMMRMIGCSGSSPRMRGARAS